MDWYNGAGMSAAGRTITIPAEAYEFVTDAGAAETVHADGWLNVDAGKRNEKVECWVSSYAGYSRVELAPEKIVLRAGESWNGEPWKQVYYLEDPEGLNENQRASQITGVLHEPREYMPGKMREYYTITYETYEVEYEQELSDGTMLYTFTATQHQMYRWGTTADEDILNAAVVPVFENARRMNRGNTGVWYQTGTWYLSGYQKGNTQYGALEVGDVIDYNAADGTGKLVTAIERTWCTDHWYVASYTTAPCTWTLLKTYASFTSLCGTLGIGVGVKVRVSRGDQSVTTKVQSIADRVIRFEAPLTDIAGVGGTINIDRVSEPDLDFICSHDNRLWGVSGRRIYCSKYDDPQDFETQTGTDADAWWADVGSAGDFTGIAAYSGAVLCFKENLVHKVLGDLPSEFTISTYNIAGIQPGSHASAQIINEVLYYKGTAGVYAFSGYTPSLISEAFGERRFTEAVGGTDGAKYWISMKNAEGEPELLCYDPAAGLWLREDALRVSAFSLYNGRCYAAAYDDARIYTFGGAVESGVAWEAVTAPIHEGSFDRKLYSKILVRAEIPEGAEIRVEISYDGKPWETLYNTRAPRWRVAVLPVRPRRCDSFRLRLSGTGDVTLEGLAREVRTGSER